MKKYTRYLIVLVLVLTIVGIARNSPAWASTLPGSGLPSGGALPDTEITITDSGLYTVGGLCTIEVDYKVSDLQDKAAVDVPAEISREVPFSYVGELYLAGCHLVHYSQDKIVSEVSDKDGKWEVCFGDRPDENLTIYYYLDDLPEDEKVWVPLPTTIKDGVVCAPAFYTGVYAPGGFLIPQTGNQTGGTQTVIRSQNGTVRPPPASAFIPVTGAYAVGGVCTMIVEYYVSGLSTEIHVEENLETSYNVPFPDNEGLLYLPGCHVFHYKSGDLVNDVTVDEGKWMICFAAIPNKVTTIYFYYAEDDISAVTSVWAPLETTTEDGMACAPLTNQTAVYAPVGK